MITLEIGFDMVVDLEKELVRANKKISTPRELLVLNEYEKHADISDNEVLNRLGLNSQMKEGQDVKNVKARELKEASEFNQEKVFHISQIKDICPILIKGSLDEGRKSKEV